MEARPKPAAKNVDPGRRMAQLALRQAMSSKLSLVSSFKRELDQKKRDKWKAKTEKCQEQVLKSSLIPPEMAEIMKKIEQQKASMNAIETKNISYSDAPKGRGRGKSLLTHAKACGAIGKNIIANHHNGEPQDFSNREHKEKITETTKKIDDQRKNISSMTREMPPPSSNIPKGRGRGRGKALPNQPKPFNKSSEVNHYNGGSCDFYFRDSIKVTRETFFEPPGRPLHQFISASENDIPSSFENLGISTVSGNEKASLQLSHSASLESKFTDNSYKSKYHTSNLFVADDEFPTMARSRGNISSREKNNLFPTDTNLSHCGQKYPSSSSLTVGDRRFSFMAQSEDFSWLKEENLLTEDKWLPLSSNRGYSSSSSLSSNDNKVSDKTQLDGLCSQGKENLLIYDQNLPFVGDQGHSLSSSMIVGDQGHSLSSSMIVGDQGHSLSSSMIVSDRGHSLSSSMIVSDRGHSLSSSMIVSDQGHSLSSSMIVSDSNKEIILQENENLLLHNTQLSATRDGDIVSFKDIIPAPKPVAVVKAYDNKETRSVSQANKNNLNSIPLTERGKFLFQNQCNLNAEKETDLFNNSYQSCIDENSFPKLGFSQNEIYNALLSAILTQFQSSSISENTSSYNADRDPTPEIPQKTDSITFPNFCEKEHEDKYINELIDTLIGKPIHKSTDDDSTDSFADKPEDKYTDNDSIDSFIIKPRDKYIDELIDSFIEESDESHVNDLIDSFIENSEDEYINDLIESFISKKSNVS